MMDQTNAPQNKRNSMVNQSMPNKRIFPEKNELNQKRNHHSKIEIKNKDKQINTDSLDEAMKELLDICQQYNDKLSMKATKLEIEKSSTKCSSSPIVKASAPRAGLTTMTNICDKNRQINIATNEDSKTKTVIPKPEHQNSNSSQMTQSGSIERLQQRQSNLQAQLDEVLQVARSLASKQKRKLKCIIEDESSGQKNNQNAQSGKEDEEEEEEEDELIEFQQIENELRISELNRQLDNIQEELRIRLYKRLLSNTNTGSKSLQKESGHDTIRRGSHTDESSPSSSSCSDEPTTSSNSAAYSVPITVTGAESINLNLTNDKNNKRRQHPMDVIDNSTGSSKVIHSTWRSCKPIDRSHTLTATQITTKADEDTTNFGPIKASNIVNTDNTALETPTNNQSDLDSAVGNMLEFGALTPTTSKESVGSSKRPSPSPAEQSTNIYSNIINPDTNNYTSMTNAYLHIPHHTVSPTCSSNQHRNNSANSDLERIEEDEEDCQDYYCDSERFRTIYEEKLSPIIYGHHRQQDSVNNNRFVAQRQDHLTCSDIQPKQSTSSACSFSQPPIGDGYNMIKSQQIIHNQQGIYSDVTNFKREGNGCPNTDSSFNSSTSDGAGQTSLGASRTSRPLTLYLPKPDEEIDLMDHIQALGHDLSIISSDLKLDSSCACGYLWKCCSNNSKKWLKRYFYFDRRSQTLSYYEHEAQLAKKNNSPKNCIQFDEISDVYVDHRRSGMGEKDRSSKRKSYVFVLATTKRKYLLASSRAETMRAWIDILFTAAKANDYFQHISNMEAQYDESFGN